MNIHKRIIPHKDYNKELNQWIPCESCTEYIIEIINEDIKIKCKNENIMEQIYLLCKNKDIIVYNIAEYECVRKKVLI